MRTAPCAHHHHNKPVLAALYYSFFLNGFVVLMLGAILPGIQESYAIDYRAAGMMLTLHSTGNLLGGLAMGVLPGLLGRKRAMLSLLFCLLASMLLFTCAASIPLLAVAFFLSGVSRGSTTNSGNSIINDLNTGKAGALNILHCFFAIGAFLSPFFVMLFTRTSPGRWTAATAVAAVLCAAELIWFFFLRIPAPIQPPPCTQAVPPTTLPFWRMRAFWIPTLLLFFYLCTETCINGWLVTYLKDSGLMSTTFAQTLSSFLWLVILLGRLFCAGIAQRVPKRIMLLCTSAGAGFFYLIMITSRSLPVVTFSLIGVGFCLAGISPTTVACAGSVVKGSPAAMSMLLTFSSLGAILMPAVTGVIAGQIGIVGGMAAILAALVAMVACAAALPKDSVV